jgi:hypothetical protein
MNYTELNNYINQLFYKYFNKYSKLTKEDKEDIKQKIMLNLFVKEEDGTLTGDVENNKNYIFLSLKNEIIYRIYKKKNLVDSYEVSPDIKISYPTIEQSIDNDILSNYLLDIVKSNNFNDIEIEWIETMLSNGDEYVIREKYKMNIKRFNSFKRNIKEKLKTALYPTYRYLLEMDSGTKYYFRNKNQLLKKIRMSQDQFDAYMTLGKTKFNKYRIQIL